MKRAIKKRIPLVLTVALNVLLLIAVLILMSYVRRLLYTDVRINLTEVVTQNKNAITSKLTLELSTLQMAADQIAERIRMEGGPERVDLRQVFATYCEDTNNSEIYVGDLDGDAFLGDGVATSIAGRRYFRLAIAGNQNVSERVVSRITGEDIFVMSVPLRYGETIVGTVQRSFSPAQMYDICTVPMFSAQGSVFIINSEGYIVVSTHSTGEGYNLEADNYFRMVYTQSDQASSRQMEDDIKHNRPGFLEREVDGKKYFSAYTPMEGIHDWYLISTIANSAVSPNADTVINMFYGILIGVVAFSGATLIYFQIYRRKQQNALENVAFLDPITGGFTFTKFQVELKNALRAAPDNPYFLLAFDIDNFKYFNSFYGFDFGDRILRSISQHVTAQLRHGELLARMSGDHFVVFLEEATQERLEQVLPLVHQVEGVMVYLSAGLYAVSTPTESMNLMVDKASMAAQSAKGSLHKQVVQYTEAFDREMVHNEQLKRQMERAIAQREMIPFYQPKVDINTGALVGAEALARWRTEDGKMIAPGEFIPLCEKTGLITDLDFCIFEQVLAFLQENLEQGVVCVPISVNFSRLHLTGDGFIHQIIAKLEQYNVPAQLIEIELTESVIFENHEVIVQFADHLHEHGLLIAMDDFGSGYSSLNMLKDIPIDVLKIDKGFLDPTNNPERQSIILSTIAEMAARLHISVVVEGVETAENVTLMKEFGCNIAQGYFFAQPMERTRFESIFQEGSL